MLRGFCATQICNLCKVDAGRTKECFDNMMDVSQGLISLVLNRDTVQFL